MFQPAVFLLIIVLVLSVTFWPVIFCLPQEYQPLSPCLQFIARKLNLRIDLLPEKAATSDLGQQSGIVLTAWLHHQLASFQADS